MSDTDEPGDGDEDNGDEHGAPHHRHKAGDVELTIPKLHHGSSSPPFSSPAGAPTGPAGGGDGVQLREAH